MHRMPTSPKKSQGFSLLEVLLATFIFSVVMVGVTSYFVSITATNQHTKRLQQNLEDVQFVMNRVAKVLRTSVIIAPASGGTTSNMRIFDYSQSRCLLYEFGNDKILEYSTLLPTGTSDEKSWCKNIAFSSPSVLVDTSNGMNLTGRFVVIPSNSTPGSEAAGLVTMNATISRQGNSTTIQTTVSLRNYREIAP